MAEGVSDSIWGQERSDEAAVSRAAQQVGMVLVLAAELRQGSRHSSPETVMRARDRSALLL
jgi:hypothetical protein